MDDSAKILVTVILLSLAYFTVNAVRSTSKSTPEPALSCECICKEGCKLFHFAESTCAVGPGDNYCCVVKANAGID